MGSTLLKATNLHSVIGVGDHIKETISYINKHRPQIKTKIFNNTEELIKNGILEKTTSDIIYSKASNAMNFKLLVEYINKKNRI